MTIRKIRKSELRGTQARFMIVDDLQTGSRPGEQQEAHREARYRKELGEHPDPRDPEHPLDMDRV